MLTQLETVKARLGLTDTDAATEARITYAIAAISAQFERRCDRVFGRTEDAWEEFNADETEIRPTCYPIESVSAFEVKFNEADGWQAITPTPAFVIRRGTVISLTWPLSRCGQGQARVRYTGGYVLPGDSVADGQTALPADLEQACVEQVSFWYTNEGRSPAVTVAQVSAGGNSITQVMLDLLPQVQTVLGLYARCLW